MKKKEVDLYKAYNTRERESECLAVIIYTSPGISNIKARACIYVYLIIWQLASLNGLTFVKQRLYTSVYRGEAAKAVAL